MAKNRRYDDAFVRDAVALVEGSGRSVRGTAFDLGIPTATLDYWYKTAMAKKGKRSPRRAEPTKVPISEGVKESAEAKIARLERENAALRAQVGQLEQDREILKNFREWSLNLLGEKLPAGYDATGSEGAAVGFLEARPR